MKCWREDYVFQVTFSLTPWTLLSLAKSLPYGIDMNVQRLYVFCYGIDMNVQRLYVFCYGIDMNVQRLYVFCL